MKIGSCARWLESAEELEVGVWSWFGRVGEGLWFLYGVVRSVFVRVAMERI